MIVLFFSDTLFHKTENGLQKNPWKFFLVIVSYGIYGQKIILKSLNCPFRWTYG